jgi:hypothetical protein
MIIRRKLQLNQEQTAVFDEIVELKEDADATWFFDFQPEKKLLSIFLR